MRTLILAPTKTAARLYVREHGIRDWGEIDGPASLYGHDPLGAEVLVLDGGGNRHDPRLVLAYARSRGITIRHDRSGSSALTGLTAVTEPRPR